MTDRSPLISTKKLKYNINLVIIFKVIVCIFVSSIGIGYAVTNMLYGIEDFDVKTKIEKTRSILDIICVFLWSVLPLISLIPIFSSKYEYIKMILTKNTTKSIIIGIVLSVFFTLSLISAIIRSSRKPILTINLFRIFHYLVFIVYVCAGIYISEILYFMSQIDSFPISTIEEFDQYNNDIIERINGNMWSFWFTYLILTIIIWSTSYFVYWWVNVLKIISLETIDWLVPVILLLLLIFIICRENGKINYKRKEIQKRYILQQTNNAKYNLYDYISEYINSVKIFNSVDIDYSLFNKILFANIGGFLIKFLLYLLNIE